MKAYADGRQLIAEIRRCFEKYDAEFEGIAEAERDLRFPETDRTPAENLSYQLGWLTLLLQWDKEERAGLQVTMPAAGYKWNDLGRLYQSFYAVYGIYTLAEQRKMLRRLVEDVCACMASARVYRQVYCFLQTAPGRCLAAFPLRSRSRTDDSLYGNV